MNYQCLAGIFRILGNPVRIKILTLLVQEPLCVSDLIEQTNKRQSYISQQLSVLRSKGWVEAEKEGLSVCYHLVDTPETQWLKYLIEEVCPKMQSS